jgi:hypothetical protein
MEKAPVSSADLQSGALPCSKHHELCSCGECRGFPGPFYLRVTGQRDSRQSKIDEQRVDSSSQSDAGNGHGRCSRSCEPPVHPLALDTVIASWCRSRWKPIVPSMRARSAHHSLVSVRRGARR